MKSILLVCFMFYDVFITTHWHLLCFFSNPRHRTRQMHCFFNQHSSFQMCCHNWNYWSIMHERLYIRWQNLPSQQMSDPKFMSEGVQKRDSTSLRPANLDEVTGNEIFQKGFWSDSTYLNCNQLLSVMISSCFGEDEGDGDQAGLI